jgi:hypothetical protein
MLPGAAAALLQGGPVRYQHGMTKGRSDTEAGSPAGGSAPAKPPGGAGPAKPAAGRDERLSAALRANLARRKVQAKARVEARKDSSGSVPGGYGDKAPEAGQRGEGTHDSAGFVGDKPSS